MSEKGSNIISMKKWQCQMRCGNVQERCFFMKGSRFSDLAMLLTVLCILYSMYYYYHYYYYYTVQYYTYNWR